MSNVREQILMVWILNIMNLEDKEVSLEEMESKPDLDGWVRFGQEDG
jgi:hypothetical protein